MKKGFLFSVLIYSSFLYSQSDTALILNEIMFYAASGNNEYIEIYNQSTTESFDLARYKIKVENSTGDLITDAGRGSILAPDSYAVILEGDYDIISGNYSRIIPEHALILKISDNAFGSGGMSNTSDRTIRLLNSADDTIDMHTYEADNSQAFSEEKIILNNSADNWGNSLIVNGTPGFKNSLAPSDFDLMISSLSTSPSIIFINKDASINLNIKNKGRNKADFYQVEVFNDSDKDSSGTGEEKIYSGNFRDLSPGDSAEIIIPVKFNKTGTQHIISILYFPHDEDLLNNTFYKKIYVCPEGSKYNDIVFSEIMYSPPAGQPEWAELFNRSDSAVNLKKWSISDNSGSVEITRDIFIGTDAYCIFSRDSSVQDFYRVESPFIVLNLPSLNNTGDALVLKDSLGIVIDSLYYLPDWGGTSGKSLERIDNESSSLNTGNWSDSKNKYGATPGYINSVSKKDFDVEIREIFFDPAAPFFGSNVSISAKLINHGRSDVIFDLMLFKDINFDSVPDTELERIDNLFLPSEDSASIKFDYQMINLQHALNVFILIMQDEDQDTSNNYLSKIIYPGYPVSSVLINEIMYSPVNGEPEWIEIYNTTGDSINLKDWSVSDIYTVPARSDIKDDVYVRAESFFVISKDSSIKYFHRSIPSDILVMNFPNLNNDADGIILKDERGSVIDSVKYESSSGRNGYSLERISAAAASGLKVNWASSTDLEMSTPGRINTASPKLNDLSVSKIFFDPQFPVYGENVLLKAQIKNSGSGNAYNFYVKFYIHNDSQVHKDEIGRVLIPLLNSGDSIFVSSPAPLYNLVHKIIGAVQIQFDPDEDTLNNYAERTIEPGFSKKALLINEVMYDPDENEPEWIEIVNSSGDTLNLLNWSVSDLLNAPVKDFISESDLLISPGELMILAKDTSFLTAHPETHCKITYVNFGSMSNVSDGVLLYDFRNAVIDSLMYKSSWENLQGYSIERIDPGLPTCDITNWAVSLNERRSSPGLPNSVNSLPVYESYSAVVNEIMYDPDTDNCEFIELYNQSDSEINIGGWKIEDEKGNFSKLSKVSFRMPAHSYFTLFSDSSGIKKYNLDESILLNVLNAEDLGFSNTGELILLKDIKGKIIDSVWFSERWHNSNFILTKNRSLERINPSVNGNDRNNWSSSADLSGATPGKINSIYTDYESQIHSKISVSPNPFSPDNDGFEDFAIINCRLTHPASQIRIKIFDSRGRLVRTLANNQTAGENTSFVFDGREDDGSSMRIGIYIIFLEAISENRGVLETLKTPVVIARKLN